MSVFTQKKKSCELIIKQNSFYEAGQLWAVLNMNMLLVIQTPSYQQKPPHFPEPFAFPPQYSADGIWEPGNGKKNTPTYVYTANLEHTPPPPQSGKLQH